MKGSDIFSAIANAISLTALGVSLISLFFTWTNNRTLLSLQEAYIVIDDILISLDGRNCRGQLCNSIITPKIKNIGESAAKNLSIEFWTCSLDTSRYRPKGKICEKQFTPEHTTIINAVAPGSYAVYEEFRIGSDFAKLTLEEAAYLQEVPTMLAFFLTYEDSMTETRKQTSYFYKYRIGSVAISEMLQREYVESYNQLLKGAQEYDPNSSSAFDKYLHTHQPRKE